MASPDPLGVTRPGKIPDRGRLRIVHDIDVVIIPQRLRTALVHVEVEFLLGLPEIVVPTLQGIVK